MAATALITGASGLIGSWVLRHWDSTTIRAVPVRRSSSDLLVPGVPSELVDTTCPDYVVHLAWCASGTAGYRRSTDNSRWVEASIELHRACRAAGARLWATGSVVDAEHDPADSYATAKSALRQQLNDDIAEGTVGWFRPHYVFDEVSRRPAVVADSLDARERDEAVELRSPDSAHDFVHASDVARGIVLAVGLGVAGELPIGSGRTHRVAELVASLGARWRHAAGPAGVTTQMGSAADVTWLNNIGWAPTRTEEFFGRD